MVRAKKILIVIFAVLLIGFMAIAVASLKRPGIKTYEQDGSVADVPQNINGLDVLLLQYGHGERKVQAGDYVLLRYEGKLPSQTVFATNMQQAEPFGVYVKEGNMTEGLRQGILGMRENEKRQIIVSPELGYGSAGSEGVPANSTLIYEVHLLDIVE